MKFVFEFDDLTYREIMDRLKCIVAYMEEHSKFPSGSPLIDGESCYIVPSEKAFDAWDEDES